MLRRRQKREREGERERGTITAFISLSLSLSLSFSSISDKNKVNGEWGCRRDGWLQQGRRGGREQGELLRENDASRAGSYQSERGKAKSTTIDATGHAEHNEKPALRFSPLASARLSQDEMEDDERRRRRRRRPFQLQRPSIICEERKPHKARDAPKFVEERIVLYFRHRVRIFLFFSLLPFSSAFIQRLFIIYAFLFHYLCKRLQATKRKETSCRLHSLVVRNKLPRTAINFE